MTILRGNAVDIYLLVKSLHVISVIAWMAGLFYLPRLYVYHTEADAVKGETAELFQMMEYRLRVGSSRNRKQSIPLHCLGKIV